MVASLVGSLVVLLRVEILLVVETMDLLENSGKLTFGSHQKNLHRRKEGFNRRMQIYNHSPPFPHSLTPGA